jgi:hypothetical protein
MGTIIKSFTEFVNESVSVEQINEKSELQIEYKAYFQELLKKYGVKSPMKLSPEKKSEFFKEVKAGWTKGVGRKKK